MSSNQTPFGLDPYIPMDSRTAYDKIKELTGRLEETKDGSERTRLYYEIMLKGLYITEPMWG